MFTSLRTLSVRRYLLKQFPALAHVRLIAGPSHTVDRFRL
jgi:hypothetical protein